AALRDVAGLDLFTGGEGLVQQAGGLQLLDDTLVDVTALRLAVRLVRSADVDALVPVDLQPAECLEQLEVALLAIARGIRVFDPEDELATGVARVGPVEQGRADQPDVRGAGRRRAETNAHIGAGCGGELSRHCCNSRLTRSHRPASDLSDGAGGCPP